MQVSSPIDGSMHLILYNNKSGNESCQKTVISIISEYLVKLNDLTTPRSIITWPQQDYLSTLVLYNSVSSSSDSENKNVIIRYQLRTVTFVREWKQIKWNPGVMMIGKGIWTIWRRRCSSAIVTTTSLTWCHLGLNLALCNAKPVCSCLSSVLAHLTIKLNIIFIHRWTVCGWINLLVMCKLFNIAGCKSVFQSVYKLAEHIRRHTQEKLVGCPTCGGLFASKVKFVDHCKRQVPVECEF
jgi:hypothetical protein